MRIHFEGLAGPVEFIEAGQLLPVLERLLRGWPFKLEESAVSSCAPLLKVECGDCDYVVSVAWREEAYAETTLVGTLSTFFVDLVEAYVRSDPARMCLHCAAVEIDEGLVVFPAASRAGKSTLTARLAAGGHHVFTDDLLVLDPQAEAGMALGIPPRLRLPLPKGLDAGFIRFLCAHAGEKDADYLYLDLPGNLQASFGERAPLRAVVLLERSEERVEARLEPVAAARAMRLLVGQSLASAGLSPKVLQAFHQLIGRLSCLQLSYHSLEEAVALLEHDLSAWKEAEPVNTSSIELRPRIADRPDTLQSPEEFQQSPGIYAKALEDRLFLNDPSQGVVCELDLIGAGIWNLLAEPLSAQEVVDILRQVFPEVEPRQIAADVERLLLDLERQGLIRRGCTPPDEADFQGKAPLE